MRDMASPPTRLTTEGTRAPFVSAASDDDHAERTLTSRKCASLHTPYDNRPSDVPSVASSSSCARDRRFQSAHRPQPEVGHTEDKRTTSACRTTRAGDRGRTSAQQY